MEALHSEYQSVYQTIAPENELAHQFLAENTLSILVALSTREYEAGDPLVLKNGWKFFADFDDEKNVAPKSLRKIPPDHVMVRSFFPFVKHFDHLVILIFDKKLEQSPTSLRISGPLGSTVMGF
jgi:hypothetical protein